MCVCVNLGRTCSRTTIRQSLPINHMTQIGIRRGREGEKLQTAARQAETPIGFHWPNQRRTTRTLPTPPATPLPHPPLREWECKSEYATESESQAKYVTRETDTSEMPPKPERKTTWKFQTHTLEQTLPGPEREGEGECSSTSCQVAKSPVA